LGVIGCDQRDRLPLVTNPLGREHRLVVLFEPVRVLTGHILVGEHRVHPRGTNRLGDVDTPDPGGGMRAAQRRTPNHVLVPQVGGIGEFAAHLHRAVRPLWTVAQATVAGHIRRRGTVCRSTHDVLPFGVVRSCRLWACGRGSVAARSTRHDRTNRSLAVRNSVASCRVSTPVGCPSETTVSPPTSSRRNGGNAPSTSAATGSAMPACSTPSIRHTAMSASLPVSREPSSLLLP